MEGGADARGCAPCQRADSSPIIRHGVDALDRAVIVGHLAHRVPKQPPAALEAVLVIIVIWVVVHGRFVVIVVYVRVFILVVVVFVFFLFQY